MSTLEIINMIEADKKLRKIEPSYALKVEVIRAAHNQNMFFAKEIIEFELIELQRTGAIEIGYTLNDKYIKVL